MVDALLEEIAIRWQFEGERLETASTHPTLIRNQSELIRTLYFGGGTPSLLDPEQIALILEKIRALMPVDKEAEITLEANPDDISKEKLFAWKSAGINRLSIGVQSFREEDLRWMNRAHNARQALDAIDLAQSAGFEDLTIDLIYGVPGLTDEEWIKNLDTAISMGIPHISSYALTVEEKTALAYNISRQRIPEINPEQQASQFIILSDTLRNAGYEHYEISNFALPGWRSIHNSSYWHGETYWGIGPSAHSYDGVSRSWNVANNALYMESVRQGRLPVETEWLNDTQRFNELVMTRLRLMEGLPLELVRKNFPLPTYDRLMKESIKHLEQGKLLLENDHLLLSKEGRLFADGIAADLFH
jgi:oxygen-independent coproporphyrinogen III oxidase